jgi:hypothetical protein
MSMVGRYKLPVPKDSGVCSRFLLQVTELVFIFLINQFMFCTIIKSSPFWQNSKMTAATPLYAWSTCLTDFSPCVD